jgi:hypothetical protein
VTRTLQIKQFDDGWGFVDRVARSVYLDGQDIDDPNDVLSSENAAKLEAFMAEAEAAVKADPFSVNVWKTRQAAINAATEAGHTVIEMLN